MELFTVNNNTTYVFPRIFTYNMYTKETLLKEYELGINYEYISKMLRQK